MLERDQWKKYSKSDNRLIEIAFEAQRDRVYVPEKQKKIYIDFKSRIEINDTKHTTREVKRIDKCKYIVRKLYNSTIYFIF